MFRRCIQWIKSRLCTISDVTIPSSDTIPTDDHSLVFRYSGKLLLRQEIDLDDSTFKQLLSNNNFHPTPSIIQNLIGYRCVRCGNKKRSMFAIIPCTRCKQEHVYCRNCIQMGRILACEPLFLWTGPKPEWPKQVDACSWQGELTKHQQRASDNIVTAVSIGNQELLVWAVAGAGKTEMLFQGIAKALSKGKRICIATPRIDVVRELLPRFRKAFPNTAIEGLYGGSRDRVANSPFLIATTHQLMRFVDAFDVIVIDEIDAFPFHDDASLIYAANRSAKPHATKIYLTATPRTEHRRAVSTKRLPVVFVAQRFHGHPLPVPTLKISFALQKSLKKHTPPKAFFDWYKNREKPNRQLLIFVPTIQLAQYMKRQMKSSQSICSADELDSAHSMDVDREEKVIKFRNGEIKVLITTTILERGVTFPSVDVVVLDAGHTVFDDAALVQIAGRAGRSPLDPTGEVIFFHDGRTDAMVKAVSSIKDMNRRREVL